MKRMIIGIFVCTLLITTTLPLVTAMNVSQTNEKNAGVTSSGNDRPIARFTWRTFGYFPFVIVDGRGSTDDGRIVKHEWQWDEGGSFFSTLRYPIWYHFYKDKKPHKITLRVTDNEGSIDVVTHVVFPRPIGGERGSYSATYISKYDSFLLEDLSLNHLDEQYTELNYVMRGAGWQQRFFKTDGSVTESTFKNDISTSNFHYHCGHGVNDWVWEFKTEIALKSWWPGPNIGDVRPDDVKNRWNGQCKWVWLHSCHILEDCTYPGYETSKFRDKWAETLNTCHMVLGYASKTYLSTKVITEFFYNAMSGDMDIVAAYKLATKASHDSSVKAAVIVDTYDQFYNDHLYGYGTVQSDETNNDNYYYCSTWGC